MFQKIRILGQFLLETFAEKRQILPGAAVEGVGQKAV